MGVDGCAQPDSREADGRRGAVVSRQGEAGVAPCETTKETPKLGKALEEGKARASMSTRQVPRCGV